MPIGQKKHAIKAVGSMRFPVSLCARNFHPIEAPLRFPLVHPQVPQMILPSQAWETRHSHKVKKLMQSVRTGRETSTHVTKSAISVLVTSDVYCIKKLQL